MTANSASETTTFFFFISRAILITMFILTQFVFDWSCELRRKKLNGKVKVFRKTREMFHIWHLSNRTASIKIIKANLWKIHKNIRAKVFQATREVFPVEERPKGTFQCFEAEIFSSVECFCNVFECFWWKLLFHTARNFTVDPYRTRIPHKRRNLSGVEIDNE